VTGGRLFVSPLARRLAREAGLDAATITGSGPDGRIVRRDVEAAIRRSANGVSSVAESSPVQSSGAAAPVIGGLPAPNGVTDVPHSRLRRAIAARLSASTQEAPHFYLRGSARVDSLMRLRTELNEVAAIRVSINDLVIKAAALAHVQVPDMNVIWTAEAIRRYSSVDIAVAVATDAGLVTPVLRDVDTASVSAIARDTADLGDRARRSALQQPELDGGTLTITNLGMYGTEEFAAIINPPHAAILAVGAVRQEPVVIEGRIDIASVMNFTLSVDHRPVDGVTAAVWMRAFIEILERPVRLLA
jgi:pyruvate dehydrogenase E2 component (dihydrolipoamide acetyltransferase)